ncbi:unnamed protein product [Polarella glacialis]|nr:unnamed protein product [Polarella glacialis]
MKCELEGLFWDNSPDKANRHAIETWGAWCDPMMPGGGVDNADNLRGEKTRPGECYKGFACIGVGQASVSTSVNRVTAGTLHSYTPMILKQILRSRKLATTGGKDELIQRINLYMQAGAGLHSRSRSRSR